MKMIKIYFYFLKLLILYKLLIPIVFSSLSLSNLLTRRPSPTRRTLSPIIAPAYSLLVHRTCSPPLNCNPSFQHDHPSLLFPISALARSSSLLPTCSLITPLSNLLVCYFPSLSSSLLTKKPKQYQPICCFLPLEPNWCGDYYEIWTQKHFPEE